MRKSLLVGIATLGVLGLVIANPVFAVDLGVGTLNDAAGESGAGFGTNVSAAQLVGNLIDILLGLLGIIFLILTIYAGFLWMTSTGDAKRVEKAKGILSTAVIGLVITLSAYSISQFVIDQLVGATGTGQGGGGGTVSSEPTSEEIWDTDPTQ